MKIPWATSEQMAKIDKLAIEKYGISVEQMMENAGRNLARFVKDELNPKSVLVLVGKGNNGGDGLVAARHLENFGVKVSVVLATEDLSEIGKRQLKILKKSGVNVTENIGEPEIILDALLGYGAKGNPRGKYAELILKANKLRKKGIKIVAVDLPSGLSCEPCIQADYTLTLALPKIGLENKGAGEIWLGDIGVPTELYTDAGLKVGNIFAKSEIQRVVP